MRLHHRLNEPCLACGSTDDYGPLSVGEYLVLGCRVCRHTQRERLPQLKKTVLYLDQNFLSAAFRGSLPQFAEAADRISNLARRQLIVCPWSSTHELETQQWSDDRQQKLWDFVRQTAHGHKFGHTGNIKDAQIKRAFDSFKGLRNDGAKLVLRDALPANLHHWDNYVYVNINRPAMHVSEIREGKREFARQLVGLFDAWRGQRQDFEADVLTELKECGQTFYRAYEEEFTKQITNPDRSPMDMSEEVSVIYSIISQDFGSMSYDDRCQRVVNFLQSEYFFRTPFLLASAQVFSVLRKLVRGGMFPNPEKAEARLLGFRYDLEAVSVFAPYSDAIFIDREMARWISDPECRLPTRYNFRVFSAASWDEFHAYLNETEQGRDEQHDIWLNRVYGQNFGKAI